jgi:hypothetical protein
LVSGSGVMLMVNAVAVATPTAAMAFLRRPFLT